MLYPRDVVPPSIMSVPLLTYRRTVEASQSPVLLGQATGFLLRHDECTYLITNWHVVTGRDPKTGESTGGYSALPEYMEASFPLILGGDVHWEIRRLELYDSQGKARWLVHPHPPPASTGTDVIALLIDRPPHTVEPYTLSEVVDVRELVPGSELSIVGYPFRVAASSAVWSRATVASEPRGGYNDDPIFLVDVRSRPGQSGSPVIEFVPEKRSETDWPPNYGSWRLAGIYSGRVDAELDLGRVWWPVVIEELLQHGEHDALQFE